jgi:hypothetical protein
LNNNLTATVPFGTSPSTYASTLVYTIVPVSAAPATLALSLSGGTPGIVTGSDSGASSLTASPCASNGTSPASTIATVATQGAWNATAFTQAFTVIPVAVGTCTFTVSDPDGTPSNPVTVTVGA